MRCRLSITLKASLLGVVTGLASCTGPGGGPVEAILEFVDAVHDENLDALYCLMAGTDEADELGTTPEERHAGFESWVLAQIGDYLEARDAGSVDLDEQGIKLVRLFVLGRGTYFSLDEQRRIADGVVRVRGPVSFGYSRIDLSGFSTGTTFYVAGSPVGRIHAIRIPTGSARISADVLTEIELEWTLVRRQAGPACDAGWAVASVAPVAGSEKSRELTWEF